MGQRAIGLLYGVEAPKLPVTEDAPEPLEDLVDRWAKAKGIPWCRTGQCIRVESEGGTDLLGVWVAVGGSGEDGVPYFLDNCVRMDKVAVVFAKSITKAKKLWDRFAAHVQRKEGITLPPAALWLTTCETA